MSLATPFGSLGSMSLYSCATLSGFWLLYRLRTRSPHANSVSQSAGGTVSPIQPGERFNSISILDKSLSTGRYAWRADNWRGGFCEVRRSRIWRRVSLSMERKTGACERSAATFLRNSGRSDR
uniref:Uncharacterized protein n=1 Tax=Cacopsylla melanoneura TaxID=428564 RepID=A0A8D9DYG5_9HEMI